MSQPHISNLETALLARLKSAAARARTAKKASEEQAEMLVALFNEVAAQAQRAGYSIEEITQRAAEGAYGENAA